MKPASSSINSPLLRIYAYYRIGLSSMLFIMFILGIAPNVLGNLAPKLFFYTTASYAILSVFTLLILWQKKFHFANEQIFVLLFIDIIFLVVLIHASGGLDSGLSLLLFVSVATGSILLKSQVSAALAAIVTILMIAETLFIIRTGNGDSRTLFASGVLGMMLFICSLAFSYFSIRLRQSAESVAAQEAHVYHLQKLAKLIIERMQTGIVVCSPSGEVDLINQSATNLLNWKPATNGGRHLNDIPELEEHIRLWQSYPHSRAPNIKTGDAQSEVRLRFANLQLDDNHLAAQASETLIYVEDTKALTQEAQQLKLASLGRLTASIAHEIRNPLGAISHAAQLMSESPNLSQADNRLAEIIETNTQRVNQIIENVLQLSRRRATKPQVIELEPWLEQFISDYREQHSEVTAIELQVEGRPLLTRIDTSHLSQILTNLTDNGLRYSEKAVGEYRLTFKAGVSADTELAFLEVIDEGDGIPVENLKHIFEPFYTTEASGSGLGLYLSKELCESNHASLNYLKAPDGRSCFHIDFAHPDRIF